MEDNNWECDGTKYFISARINDTFDMVGVWSHHADSHDFRYIGQFWKYLQQNKALMTHTIIAGDFNSNKIWDEPRRYWNHSDVVIELEETGIRSLCHEYKGEMQGEEKTPTFYLQKHMDKRYHIDYVFATEKYLEEIVSLEIGEGKDWIELSDHMPLIFELSLNNE